MPASEINPYIRIIVRAFLAASAGAGAQLTAIASAVPPDTPHHIDWVLIAIGAFATFSTTAYAGWASLDDASPGTVNIPTDNLHVTAHVQADHPQQVMAARNVK